MQFLLRLADVQLAFLTDFFAIFHQKSFRHFWGTASPTFESLRTTKYNFLVL